ncbi:MAG: hypothetical protein RR595_15200, partial [Lysinibacillus sp.]
DGNWYHVDPTWNDPIGNKNDEVRYKYFMLTDKQISKTHFWEKEEYPAAKSEKYKDYKVAQYNAKRHFDFTQNVFFYRAINAIMLYLTHPYFSA